MLFMPRSHSTTLFCFYFPDHSVVFAPDMMFVQAMPPFGFPDWYYPGYIRALDRLIALDAAHYVPSHFDEGGKADLVAYRDMMVDFRDTVTAGQITGPDRRREPVVRRVRLRDRFGFVAE